MARPARRIDILGGQVEWHCPETLDDVNAKKSIDRSCGPAYALEIGAKARGILHRADRDNPRIRIYKSNKLVRVETSVNFRCEPQLDAKCVTDTPPRIEIRGKFAGKAHDVVARLPFEAVGDRRKAVRRVSQESDLIGSDVEHCRDQRPAAILGIDPILIVG